MRPRAWWPLILLLLSAPAIPGSGLASKDVGALPAERVDAVGITVSNMAQALDFYTQVLPFTVVSDVEASGREYELLTGVFGAHSRIVTLALGDERFVLTEFLAPPGQPMPADVRSHDRLFQHVALIVTDMEAAYGRLRRHGVRHASTGPQRLPDWNPQAGGIRAFYFRDPDGHFLELLQFPPGKGDPKWHRPDPPLFLGIDHTALVVADTDHSLQFYRDTLGLRLAGASENHGQEQERLNNVFGARLRITTLRAAGGPGVELLEYLAPGDGRPAPPDLRANDLAHWETTMTAATLEPLLPLARAHRLRLVSPGPVSLEGLTIGGVSRAVAGALVRDPDGHGVRLVAAHR